MRVFNKLDRNAPRFRKEKVCLVNREMFDDFKKEFPQYKNVPNQTLKSALSIFHKLVKTSVTDTRDGIELLEQLGYIFLGSSCKMKGVDYVQSDKLGLEVKHHNWESNQWLCKIYYTNFGTKYRFKNSHLWAFEAIRQFRKQASDAYIKNYKLYIIIDKFTKLSAIFRRHNKAFWEKRKSEGFNKEEG